MPKTSEDDKFEQVDLAEIHMQRFQDMGRALY